MARIFKLETVRKFGRKPSSPNRERRTASDVVDEILEFFGDGELHELKEVADAVKLPEDEVEKVLDFLAQFGLVKRGVRITNSGRNFLTLPVEKRKKFQNSSNERGSTAI